MGTQGRLGSDPVKKAMSTKYFKASSEQENAILRLQAQPIRPIIHFLGRGIAMGECRMTEPHPPVPLSDIVFSDSAFGVQMRL